MAVQTRAKLDVPVSEDGLVSTLADMTGVEIQAERRPEQIASFIDWSRMIPTARGGVLDFARYPYQPEVYEVFGDVAVKEADAMKSVQVGMSELLTRLTLWLPDLRATSALYVFPALKQMWDYSDARVNPLREQSKYLQSKTLLGPGWTWNKGQKRIGLGRVYYRGSESKRDLIAVDADLVALDEYDQLLPPNIPQAERRVANSEWALIRRIGVPSDPEYGIAKRYAASDKRQWLVKCGACNDWQPITFWKNVRWDEDEQGVVSNAHRACGNCDRPLDVSKGEWVAEHPERQRPGFHVHRLIVPHTNLATIIEASKQRDPTLVKVFFNEDLGLPFAEKSGGLDRQVLAQAMSAAESYFGHELLMEPAYRGTNLVTMGVDVASVRALNYRISEHLDPLTEPGHRKRALAIGTADSFDEIIELLHRYNVHFCCIDQAPEYRLAAGVAERFPGRVYLAHYPSQQKEVLVVDTENRRVSAQRVPAIDAMIAVLRAMRNLLPVDPPADYVTHMVSIRRRVEKDEYDRQTVTYEAIGPTDYAHAEVYDLLATEVAKVRLEAELMLEQEGEIVSMDDRLEYERARVTDPENTEYRPGPGGAYSPGPEE